MRKFSVFLAVAFLLSWVGSSWAGRPPNTSPDAKLKLIGTYQTADSDLASGGHDVAKVIVSCGASACTVTLANGDGSAAVAGDYGEDSAVRIEYGAPAGEARVLDLSDSPITFADGIMVQDDGNVSGVGVYEFR